MAVDMSKYTPEEQELLLRVKKVFSEATIQSDAVTDEILNMYKDEGMNRAARRKMKKYLNEGRKRQG